MRRSTARRNGGVSHWFATTEVPGRRPPLPGDRSADVCVVGGGFTGLWAAYYLKRARPELDVVVLEREFAGFGASGRNGGWLSSEFSASRAQIARDHGLETVRALQRTAEESVDEVIAVCRQERIEADVVKSGILHVARGAAQLDRLRRAHEANRALGLDADVVELDAAETERRLRVAGADGALANPHAARVQPARLVRGLAAAVERLGVPIYEGTAVTEVRPGRACSDRGTVTAPHVLICLEGFTASLRGHRRDWVPLNSAIVATEPLPDDVWEQIGWSGCELLGDNAHAYMYAQRTADGRIAFGGRGVPYRFGSRTDVAGRTQQATIDQLTALLHAFFPATASAAIDHAWCGVLGVPRDWTPAVRLDRATGIGMAGGYVGSGVATANLAGRTLRDLVLGQESELTALPWVGHRSRRWEPEPLRFLGAHLVYSLYRAADRRELGGSTRTSRLASIATRLAGR
ncbi:NAD(P)/FAD-dependent oxidoreductase [Conexibacter woesei]|uniref:FAD dependent oxidoreductase n=1 Tax=Conexibacter woesei (strain DSM 14684 / CCUG 47730 / CIP 108061 / JCM 11494 / NBRC 100937 / ID131577) TaxID=469383 RepID=D3F2K8_CONWI|nr:FAD-dependent oxidoreductase [Conexibacter woesei]ADB52274.1 FAD dependent oxidoreductase [Conexibacter woesei DSM 14684]